MIALWLIFGLERLTPLHQAFVSWWFFFLVFVHMYSIHVETASCGCDHRRRNERKFFVCRESLVFAFGNILHKPRNRLSYIIYYLYPIVASLLLLLLLLLVLCDAHVCTACAICFTVSRKRPFFSRRFFMLQMHSCICCHSCWCCWCGA